MKRELRRLTRKNLTLAEERWLGELNKRHLQGLRSLTENYRFAIELDDLLFLDGKWYVTHAGLLRLAARRHCAGIKVQQVRRYCDPAAGYWVFKATVYKNPRSKGFVSYGDADPSNTSPLVRGGRNAGGGDSGCQPCSPQGLRNRTLLSRRAGLAYWFFGSHEGTDSVCKAATPERFE